jgi:hypothetical protein
MQGKVENGLFELANKNPTTFEAYAFRPGGVLKENPGPLHLIMNALAPSIYVNDLAAAMIDTALNGNSTLIMENEEISRKGKDIIKRMKTS